MCGAGSRVGEVDFFVPAVKFIFPSPVNGGGCAGSRVNYELYCIYGNKLYTAELILFWGIFGVRPFSLLRSNIVQPLVFASFGAVLSAFVLFAGVYWKGPMALCLKGVLCVRSDPHGAAQQIHVSWRDRPDSSLTVTWVTSKGANSAKLQYRTIASRSWTTVTGQTIPVPRNGLLPSTGNLHRVTLTNLLPGTDYLYRVSANHWEENKWSSPRQVRTAPSDGPITFAFLADTGLTGRLDGLASGVEGIVQSVLLDQPTFVLGGGDYAYANRDGRFMEPTHAIDQWFRQMEPLISHIPFMTTYGNHETRLAERLSLWALRFAHFPGYDNGTTYSFDVGNVHIISILADGYAQIDQKQLEWIESDLADARNRGVRWIITFHHEPVFGFGKSHPARANFREHLTPILERYHVDLDMSAHDQNYERTFPIVKAASAPEITSAHLSDYRAGEGVIYAKVSPAGKKSEIVRNFSSLPAQPDAVIAARNDKDHHYALVTISDYDLSVDVYGLGDDGSTKHLVDRFSISADNSGAVAKTADVDL